jgi:methyltransferase (TIGR00027 family)
VDLEGRLMEAGAPSRTALAAALYRAAHQLVDRPPVFVDPLAVPILGRTAAVLRRPGERWCSAEAASLRAFVAVRSRLAEDAFGAAHARGLRQYVVLGAGLDTFACRAPLPDVTCFEVDHPATQAWKRERLAEAGIAVPATARFAAVDFERETLLDGLGRAGFDPARPAFFAWLGVTPYLTPEAVTATLRQVAGLAAGSELVFDFASPTEEGSGAAGSRRDFDARVERVGEPVRCLLTAAGLRADLPPLGYREIELLDAGELGRRYLEGRSDGLRLRGGRMARVRTGAPP